MTLQSTGPISLGDIQGEFGGASPVSLSNYFRGGPNVPNHDNTLPIPTSGAISLTDFYGTSVDPPQTILTAEITGSQNGFRRLTGIGSIVPDETFNGWDLEQCTTDTSTFRFSVKPPNQADNNGTWASLSLTGTFVSGTGTMTYVRSARNSFLADTGGASLWQFNMNALGQMINGNQYVYEIS